VTRRENLFCGELVRLAAPAEGDAEVFARWTEDAEYLRALDTDYARPMSVGEMAKRLEQFIDDPSTVEFRIRTLADDRLIGFVALHSIEWNNRAANLAIGIGNPTHRGQGYGTDALRVVLRYAFHELSLERVGLNVNANNARAIRAYEKVGFHHEGAMRHALLRDGEWQDRIIMGILYEEWDAERRQQMAYYFGKQVEGSFDEVIDRVTEALKTEGFGVLTEIDVRETMRKKLDVDFRNYRILGACNPPLAHKALTMEDKIGTMLPCNVIVQELGENQVEIAAVDPVASMQAIDNPALGEVAHEVQARLRRVVDKV